MTILGATLLVALLLLALDEFTGRLAPGGPAPDVSWTDATGQTHRLSDERGRHNVILTFYPRDFTPGCTRHLCAFRDAHAAVDRLQAVVLAVSYDSPDSHRRFAEAERLPFTLLSDGDRAISRRYGAARFGGLFPVPRRMTVVIDRRGIVRSIIRSEFAVGRHLEESLEVLQRIVAEEEGGSPLR